MKTEKVALTLMAALLYAAGLMGQDAIDKYFGALSEDPDVTSIVISSKMFQLFAKIDPETEDGKTAVEAMKGLTGIKILTKDTENGMSKVFNTSMKSIGSEYETLMSIDEKDEKVRFFIREEGDTVKELLMVVGAETNFFVMSISGIIDLEKLSSLSKSMNVGGMNYLENLDDNNKQKNE